MSILTSKFPTLLGLGFLVIGLVGALYLVRQKQTISPRAAETQLSPVNPVISNISDRSFTVSWITQTPVNGSLKIGSEASDVNQIITETAAAAAVAHSVTAENLNSSTKYYFRIGSGNSFSDKPESLFTVTTAAALSHPPAPDIAQGIIKTQADLPAANVLVYIQLPGGQLLSTITTSSGNWIIPLSMTRSGSLTDWLAFDRSSATYTIQVTGGGTLGQSTAVVTTALDHPVPLIILGNSYDFRHGKEPISSSSPSPEPQKNSAVNPVSPENQSFNFDSPGDIPLSVSQITLDNPSANQEKLSTDKPEFFGSGPADTKINITVRSSQNIVGQATVNDSGRWSFSPPDSLSDGQHSITLTWVDTNGILQTIERSFIVNAAGNEPSFTSTPSAVPSRKITPWPISPTAAPTIVPRKTIPSTRSAVPKSGDLTPSLIIFIMGATLAFAGFVLIRQENCHGS